MTQKHFFAPQKSEPPCAPFLCSLDDQAILLEYNTLKGQNVDGPMRRELGQVYRVSGPTRIQNNYLGIKNTNKTEYVHP